MKIFILAGGEGTRLRPYTYSKPKPMLEIKGIPILGHVIENIKRSGMTDIVMTVGYKHEQIILYFGDGKKFGVKIEYLIEKEKMNTAGSIIGHKNRIKDTFAVVMGDHITDIDLSDMLKHHKKNKAMTTIALYKNKIALEYGIADVKKGRVVGFSEKPVIEHLYNTAIYIFEPEIFDYIKEKDDFAKDVIPRLLAKKKNIQAYIFEGTWHDVGRVEDYEKFAGISSKGNKDRLN
ncbi:nucleotidyltransferase family protein [Candidatus Micrarchaeota archaeon]|nr:nucleotidyltransferase family protein [Candidatus Micrarchaeota archaeon]MBU1165305.1 nucleotidyltransferase family protein [Candidatus Micrarchaeota archaeon]MBU1886139.1 nucleotidyltransferase family protein [Candidatus Micrarchaeota archaeon]